MFIKKVGCNRLIYTRHLNAILPKSSINQCKSDVYMHTSSVTLLSKLSKS